MKLSVGIVGLPNVGKSTLFNALLKRQVADVASYPFSTIEPNIGMVEVPDERLGVLAKLVEPKKIVPAVVRFVDIAGLVKGASQGEGLGNQFLSHIREVNAIAHVVRFFEDPNVSHVSGRVDAALDIAIIKTELILADLQTLDKQVQPKGKVSHQDEVRWRSTEKLKESLNNGHTARYTLLEPEERIAIEDLHLLTNKPTIYVFNISTNQLTSGAFDAESIRTDLRLKSRAVSLCGQLEAEVAEKPKEEQKELFSHHGLRESGLETLIHVAYETLGLVSFFTVGPDEVRAWTIQRGTIAKEAAGAIHTDFVKGFIKAEVCDYEAFLKAGSWKKAKELGLLRFEGKEYQVRDGDIIEFCVHT